MALITRFARLFTADLHAVLDRIEEPGILLKQAVREMEEALAHMRDESRAQQQELTRIDAAIACAETELAELGDELDLCFAGDEEVLARSLIKRRLEIERHTKMLRMKRSTTAGKLDDLATAIKENERHLGSMAQKLELFTDEAQRSEPPCSGPRDYEISEAEIQVAYLREKQRRMPS